MKGYKDLSLKYLRVQRRRTILTIVGIILSVALITGVQILYASFMDMQEREARELADYHGYFKNIEYDSAIKIKNFVDVKNAVYMKNEGLTFIKLDESTDASRFMNEDDKVAFEKGDGGIFSPLRVKGLDSEGFKRFKIELLQGRMPETEDEIILMEGTLKKLTGVKLGDTVSILLGKKVDENGKEFIENYGSQNERFVENGIKNYKIVGIAKDKWVYSRDAELAFTKLMDNKKGDYNVFIDVKKPRNTYKIAENIGKNIGLSASDEYRFQGNEQLLAYYGGSKNYENNLTILLIIALVTVIIVISAVALINNSFNISIVEKSSEYGMLRAIGASPKQLRKLVYREASLMSAISIPFGILGGFIGVWLLLLTFRLVNYNIIKQMDLRIVVKPGVFIASMIISLITVYISAIVPAKRAGRVSPIEALKKVERNIKIKKLKKFRLIGTIFGAEGEIAYKNLSRNKKRFIITVFSLSLSVVLYIGFNSLVNQFFQVSKSELEKYSYAVSPKNIEKSKIILNDLKTMDNVEKTVSSSTVFTAAVVPEGKILKENIWWGDGYNDKKNLELYNSRLTAYNEEYIERLNEFLLEGKIDISKLDEGGIILLQRNIERKDNKTLYVDYTKFKTGDSVEFADVSRAEKGIYEALKNAELKKAKVIGVVNSLPIFGEYPNQGIYMVTTVKGLQSLGMKPKEQAIYITKKPNSDGSGIVNYLNSLNEKGDVGYFLNIEAREEETRQMLITMSMFIYSFITLVILISSVNIFNTISSNLYTRKRELGVIKSVGMSQKSLRKMVYLEGFYYGLFSIIYGGAAGTGLSYAFYRIMDISQNVKWNVNIKALVTASIGILIITTLSTYLPLRKLDTSNIIESIRTEN